MWHFLRLGTLAVVMAGCSAPPEHARDAPPLTLESTRAPAAAPRAAVAAVPPGTPYLPAQCYTRTIDESGRVHNPCFTCHADGPAPNYIADGALQLSYDLPPAARKNPWTNLFVDRTDAVARLSDEEILTYVRNDNYAPLRARLTEQAFDEDRDGKFAGYLPDIAFHFDEQGFDRASDQSYTGWRAYAYFPLPGAFWPTQGSFGDALIRLPAAYRENTQGALDLSVYAANLALLEVLIKRADVAIAPLDERAVGADLDGDGRLGVARVVRYRFDARHNPMRWAGRAGELQARGELGMVAGLFPLGTELAHSLRYLDVQGERVTQAARMKELRYMVKRRWLSAGALEQAAASEAAEKASSPEKTRLILGSAEGGIDNRAGWQLQGFIEDAQGELRPQTLEEHAFCIGCHSGLGVTDDSVFSFGRKLEGQHVQGGWFHPSQHDLTHVAEPTRADGRGEYTFYLEQNGAGDELRENHELVARFFSVDGQPNRKALREAQADITRFLLPSPARALVLDKAYRTIVREQSYVRGRDPTVSVARNVHRELPAAPLPTGVREALPDRRVRMRRRPSG